MTGWHCDIACYTLDGVKVFAFQSQMFKDYSFESKNNGVEFIVQNVGFSESDLRLDVGIKKNVFLDAIFSKLDKSLIRDITRNCSLYTSRDGLMKNFDAAISFFDKQKEFVFVADFGLTPKEIEAMDER